MVKRAIDHLGNEYQSIVSRCHAYNVDYGVYYARLARGMSVEQALTGNFLEFHNEFEKAEARRSKFASQNLGQELTFPVVIGLSDIKAPSFYERKAGIYMIRNINDGNVYIGQAVNLYERLHEHKAEPFHSDKNRNTNLNTAIRNEGIENFECQILSTYPPTTKHINEILNYEEQKYIDYFESFFPNGYNMTLGGQGTPRISFSAEEIKELSKDYTSGMSIRDLCKKYGVCRETVRMILRRNNVPVRENYSTDRDAEICRLYIAGSSINKIAKQTGYSKEQVKTSLKRNNVATKRHSYTNQTYPELRKYYPLLDVVKEKLFAEYESGIGLRKLEDIYCKHLDIEPRTRVAKEHLIKSYLIEIGGFDVAKRKSPMCDAVYMLNGSGEEARVIMEFGNASIAARYLSKKLGKTVEQCRSNISAVMSNCSGSKAAYGFGFTRKLTPEQALDYVLGTYKTVFTKKNGKDAYKDLIFEYVSKHSGEDPVRFFKGKIGKVA